MLGEKDIEILSLRQIIDELQEENGRLAKQAGELEHRMRTLENGYQPEQLPSAGSIG